MPPRSFFDLRRPRRGRPGKGRPRAPASGILRIIAHSPSRPQRKTADFLLTFLMREMRAGCFRRARPPSGLRFPAAPRAAEKPDALRHDAAGDVRQLLGAALHALGHPLFQQPDAARAGERIVAFQLPRRGVEAARVGLQAGRPRAVQQAGDEFPVARRGRASRRRCRRFPLRHRKITDVTLTSVGSCASLAQQRRHRPLQVRHEVVPPSSGARRTNRRSGRKTFPRLTPASSQSSLTEMR